MFTYTNTKYVNSRTFITITCRIHGDIQVKPMGHIRRGTTCKLCKYASRKDKPSKKKTVTPVGKFTLQNELLTEYESIALAVLDTPGANSANISSCCSGKRKTHKGLQWKYR